MDGFIKNGSGIGFGLCRDILHPVIVEEKMISIRFNTDLNDPSKVIAQPSGVFRVPRQDGRVGDVFNGKARRLHL